MRFEANLSKFFAVSDCLVVLTNCSDAERSRSGDFYAADKTDCFTLCACAWGNNVYCVCICERGGGACMCVSWCMCLRILNNAQLALSLGSLLLALLIPSR